LVWPPEQSGACFDDGVLCATEPIVRAPRGSPLAIVGVPRSGSTFLAYVASHVRDWWIFDDVYFYQWVKALRIADDQPLTPRQLCELVVQFRTRLWARVRFPKFRPPNVTTAQLDAFTSAILATFADRAVLWHELFDEMMTRLARHHGCSCWGYKTPQDFMSLAALRRVFPQLRVLFLYRDPRAVLASYKFNHPDAGHRGQYHPLVYALYWRLAVQTMRDAALQMPGDLLEVKFEELVKGPDLLAQQLAAFLGSTAAPVDTSFRPNTSFAAGKRQELNPTETWICQLLAGDAMRQKGYALQHATPRASDLPELLHTSVRFASHQIQRMQKNRRMRRSVHDYLRALPGLLNSTSMQIVT
jgi:hypothetical protein